VVATLEELQGTPQSQSRNLRSIVNRVRPAVESVLESFKPGGSQSLLDLAVRANIRAAANQLRHGSALLEQLVEEDGLLIVGAEYSLETGIVNFLEAR
jgi:carbonic anhydrase